MKTIIFENEHRKKHFEFFNGMNHPHFNITANVDVTAAHAFFKSNGFPFTFSLVYLLSRAANETKEFRWRIRAGQVVEHKVVHPSFTVPTQEADVFSFCTVGYDSNPHTFIREAAKVNDAMKTDPSLEDEAGRDDYLFMSALPWVSFTSIQHAMNYHPHDSVPRISWGKFFTQNNQQLMPLAVQVHHALVDGRHIGRYFEKVEALLHDPEKTMTIYSQI